MILTYIPSALRASFCLIFISSEGSQIERSWEHSSNLKSIKVRISDSKSQGIRDILAPPAISIPGRLETNILILELTPTRCKKPIINLLSSGLASSIPSTTMKVLFSLHIKVNIISSSSSITGCLLQFTLPKQACNFC